MLTGNLYRIPEKNIQKEQVLSNIDARASPHQLRFAARAYRQDKLDIALFASYIYFRRMDGRNLHRQRSEETGQSRLSEDNTNQDSIIHNISRQA
jgi:transposase-like protein